MEIRAAEQGDDIAVSALIAEYGAAFAHELGDQDVVGEGMKAQNDYETGALIVAADGDELVGCVAYEPAAKKRCRMSRLYVLEEHRRKGLGRKLAEFAVEGARSEGYSQMILDTTQGMAEARALYTDMGFEEWTPDYEAPRDNIVYMQMAL